MYCNYIFEYFNITEIVDFFNMEEKCSNLFNCLSFFNLSHADRLQHYIHILSTSVFFYSQNFHGKGSKLVKSIEIISDSVLEL